MRRSVAAVLKRGHAFSQMRTWCACSNCAKTRIRSLTLLRVVAHPVRVARLQPDGVIAVFFLILRPCTYSHDLHGLLETPIWFQGWTTALNNKCEAERSPCRISCLTKQVVVSTCVPMRYMWHHATWDCVRQSTGHFFFP